MSHHHHHHHHHHHIDAATGDRRVVLAVAVNFGLTVMQVIGGLLSGSLALIADALHNFSDAIALLIAFGARRIARRPADADMTFGYGRAEVVAALINYTTLIVIGVYLVYEALFRFVEPRPVNGWLVVWIAALALAVDAITALLTYRLAKTSVNIRAAFLHNLADALGSVAVIIAGTLILLFGLGWVDPLVTLLIAGYILWMSIAEIGGVIRILMLGSPPDIDSDRMVARIGAVAGVAGVHHAHLWQMGEHEAALDAHIVVEKGQWHRADSIKSEIRQALHAEFDMHHTTLELECAEHACESPQLYGHR